MKEFLRKVKLSDQFTVELEIERSVFVRRFMEMVEPGGTSRLTPSFEMFSSSKKEYRGSVSDYGFTIRRRRRLFDSIWNMAVAKGKWRQRDNHLVIDTEVSSFSNFFIVFYGLVLVIYAIVFSTVLFTETPNETFPFFIFPFLFLHAAFMLGIPYMMMRRSTQRMKYDLTRELHYIAANKKV